jgi:hypothetical protein
MPDGDAQPISVRGGTGGIEAHYDDMVDAAHLLGAAATELAETSAVLHRYLLDPGLGTGGLLDPAGAAAVEMSLADALDGPSGITFLAARCAALDVALRAAAAAYEASDRIRTDAHDVADGFIGLPGALVAGTRVGVRTGSPRLAAQRLITADPALADDVVTALGGVRGAGFAVATDLARDGTPVVRDLGTDPAADAAAPPRNIRDLIAALARRNEGRHGEIDVRIIRTTGGARAAIVDIPGTKSWQPLPNHDVTSVATDLRAIAGRSSAYESGVFAALARAGVRNDDDVMLVGHSEGGIVAAQAAIDARRSGRFRVTHVVTAGAPIGAIAHDLPAAVRVLAIENRGDVVPHADGHTNPDRVGLTTVTVHRDSATVAGNHSLRASYLPGASDIDASGDVSVRDFVRSAAAFLHGDTVQTQRFLVTRAP